MLSNKIYDVLRRVATLVLPIIGLLYFAFCITLGSVPKMFFVGIILFLIAAISVVLEISSRNYNKKPGGFTEETMLCDTEAD